MADLGLIGGIADGFKQGLQSYQQQKQMNFNNRILLADMMSKGFKQDDQGNITPGEGLIAQQKAGLLKSQHDIGQYDTDINNPVTSGAYAATKQSLAASNPGQKFNLPEGLSAADLTGENSVYGKDIAGGYAKQAGQLKVAAMSGPGSRVDEMKNQSAAHAGGDFEKTLKPYRNVQNSLDRAIAILNSDQPLTKTQLNVAKQDYVNSVAQGGQATEGKASREIENTFLEGLNSAMYKAGETGDLRKIEPGIVNNLAQNIHQMKGEWQNAASSQAADLADNYASNTNPRVQDTVRTKLQRYAPDVYTSKYGSKQAPSNLGATQQGLLNQGVQASTPHPQDSQAIDWAQANPKDPRSAAILQANGVK